MNKIPYKKLEKIAEIVIPKIINNIIIDTDNGYVVFNQYYIEKNKTFYKLIRRGDEKTIKFSKLKNAITYAILHKNYKMFEANRVYELDYILEGIDLEKSINEKKNKKLKINDFLLKAIKLQSILDKRRRFEHELDKYIIVAKDCQQKGFENEINRTKRK